MSLGITEFAIDQGWKCNFMLCIIVNIYLRNSIFFSSNSIDSVAGSENTENRYINLNKRACYLKYFWVFWEILIFLPIILQHFFPAPRRILWVVIRIWVYQRRGKSFFLSVGIQELLWKEKMNTITLVHFICFLSKYWNNLCDSISHQN